MSTPELNIGVFLDRVNGKANAIILNPENNRYAFIGKDFIAIKEDTYDGLFDAVNEVCNMLQAFSKGETEIEGHKYE